jgi:endo-1,4-beta-xylanase
MLTRRQAISGTAKLVGALTTGALGKNLADAAPASSPSAAQQKVSAVGRVPYGACVRLDALEKEADYRAALKSNCQQVTPEGDMTWHVLRPTRKEFKFENADSVLAFAEGSGMTMRGHALVWYGAMPDWTKEISNAAEAERELTTHIETVMGRYRGKIKTWHVVNEPIDDAKGPFPGLRPNIWHKYLGEKYIDLAFQIAHRVDPACELILNEYDIESIDRYSPKRRMAYLKLIRDLRSRGVPLHGVGMQGHIHGKNQIDRDGVISFVDDVRATGLSIHVTELDVIDNDLPGPVTVRDAIIAARVHDFLEPIFAVTRPAVVATWGIADRHTWVPMYFKRKDGLANRPLPFDEKCQPKLMWNVIDYFCQKTA